LLLACYEIMRCSPGALFSVLAPATCMLEPQV
jgi:hypothetical protein